MVGTIPLSLTQQFDEFGKPLSGGLLYIMQAGTVATPQNPYSDSALSVVMPNPIPLDAAGRIPQFFLDTTLSSFIKIRLTDKNGVTQIARDGVMIMGTASGGGGGGSVDPTTLVQTGMLAVFYGTGSINGYVRANGRSIGPAGSGATEAGGTGLAVQALFTFLYNADPNLILRNSGGGAIPRTGSDATAAGAWTNVRQLDLPDWRGRVICGLDDMGNVAAGRLTNPNFNGKDPSGNTVAPTVLGAAGGSETKTVVTANLPPYTPAGAVASGQSQPKVLGGAAGANVPTTANGTGTGGGLIDGVNPGAGQNVTFNPTFTGTPQGGTSTPLSVQQPTLLATIYLKL